jgi:hypothetical protein
LEAAVVSVPEMSFPLKYAYSLICIPFEGTGIPDAETLVLRVPKCGAVWALDAQNQTWSGHVVGGLNNFAIEPGRAYLVGISTAGVCEFAGTWASPTFYLKTGYNLIALPKAKEYITTAEALAQEVLNCTGVWTWDEETQTWLGHPAGGPRDFPVELGQAYLIHVSADTIWPQ